MLQRTSARTLRLEADSPPRNLGELPGPALLPVSQLREASARHSTQGLREEHKQAHLRATGVERFLIALLTKRVLAASWREMLSTPAWKARGGPGPLSLGVREPFSSTPHTLPSTSVSPAPSHPVGCSSRRVRPRNRAVASGRGVSGTQGII